ncbi:carbohydrate ABC transporter permease [Clostridium frigidicarnis]|uniref:Carbohydrate ABC transporter membrane protein 1, CUT1 family n=1 Tax=Clostridium frigidicarnis TaxID=84698 RepID=A0A1I0XH62_9CLOT|nr:sugar ABC transporter permease [Clostridium frigidicarnis]SFB00027.1 carbohydrate ABC transporter membrane protein 1, CUT1 family [Clostridium frigidicarnis]
MKEEKNIKSFIRGIVYISPVLIILIIFSVYPIIKTIDMSFYNKYNYIKDIVFQRGLNNYKYIFNDTEFFIALKNTVIYVLWVMPLSISISLLIAVFLNSKIKFKELFRTIYFIPFVTSTVAISMVWRWIFNSEYGVLNYLLGIVNINPINWLTDPKYSMVALIILSIWKSLGYNIIIFLAGLQNIDDQYGKAAQIDGANKWRILTKITIPLLSPTILFVSVVSLINSFKVFGEVYALFNKIPGPLNSCLTMVYYIYNKFYNQYHYGIASAAVVVLYIIILILNFIQFRVGKKKVEYTN